MVGKGRPPCVIATTEDFERIQYLNGKDPFVTGIINILTARAEKLLEEPCTGNVTIDGYRLDGEKIQRVIEHLSFLYRISGDRRYARRAIDEMESVCDFPDWQPEHFLSTASVATGMAIGFDWLYDELTEENRSLFVKTIEDFALKPAIEAYQGTAILKKGQWFGQIGWTHCQTNWNGVCNCGMIMAAAAVRDSGSELAKRVLVYAEKSLALLPEIFEPDGGFEEGISYWLYLHLYLSKGLATLENLTGASNEGFFTAAFRKSLDYADAMNHGDFTFNFHDVGVEDRIDTSPIMYFAGKFGRNDLIQKRVNRFLHNGFPIAEGICTTDLIWYHPETLKQAAQMEENDVCFRKIETVVLRHEDTAIALHGGSNAATHSHMDSGSIILDALDERWFCDLGKEPLSYLPNNGEYGRWDLYRMRAEGHNTLVVNPDRGPGQIEHSFCSLQSFCSEREFSEAVLDLSPAYPQQGKITRTVRLDKKVDTITVTDEICLEKQADIYSFFHTRAAVQLMKGGVLLKQHGKTMHMECNYPVQLFEAMPMASSPKVLGQAENTGVKRIAIVLKGVCKAKIVTILKKGVTDL